MCCEYFEVSNLNDTYKKKDSTRVQLFRFAHAISLPICDAFFDKQGKSSYLLFLRERSRIDSKCCWLLLKQREELLNNNIRNIRPIRYYQKTVCAVDVYHDRDGVLEASVSVRLSLYPNVQNLNVETVREMRLIVSPFFH